MLAAIRLKKGFSLVELVVLISIVGIVTAISIPSFTSYVRSNRLSTSVDRMAADLQMTRTMAISRGQILIVRATGDGYTISEPVSGAVLRDREFEGDISLAAGDTVSFFPWGMADAANFNVQSGAGSRTINILPTGIVEVN